MSWAEFATYLNGLTSESPLGRVVAIRAEDDAEKIKQFTPAQKALRNEWRRRQVQKKTPEQIKAMYQELQSAVVGAIGSWKK